jgi:hypothetical protein
MVLPESKPLKTTPPLATQFEEERKGEKMHNDGSAHRQSYCSQVQRTMGECHKDEKQIKELKKLETPEKVLEASYRPP